jgi:hypothetical protein
MTETTRGALRLLLTLWFLAGAILLIALLTKGNVEPLATRTGVSALAAVLLGYAVAAGCRLAERPTPAGLIGAFTLLISISTFVLLAVEIWSKHPLHEPARTEAMAFLSLFLGTISLLLDSERDEDEGPVRLARGIACLALVVLGVLVVIGASGGHVSARLGGFVAALFIIPVLSLPALRLLGEER